MKSQIMTVTSKEEVKILSFINSNFANETVTPIEGTNSLYKIKGLLPLESKTFEPDTRYQIVMPVSNVPVWYIPSFKLINTVKPYTEEEIAAYNKANEANEPFKD